MIDRHAIRQRWEADGSKRDERGRRLFAASEARAAGWGGLAAVSNITGLARSTIERGLKDLDAPPLAPGQVRREGGGPRPLTETDATLLDDLKRLVEPATLGDPVRPLLWVSKSLDKLASALVAMGHSISPNSVRKLLTEIGFSRQVNRKADEGSGHPDRNAQFEYINAEVLVAQAAGQPVISVDTKKKELVGNYRNAGSDWRPKGAPRRVKVHDFEDKKLGKVAPYGVYDIAADAGWVSVGITCDTAEFAVASIRTWLERIGRARYPKARELTITADCGGSNGSRVRLWKVELQKLADETGLTIKVRHYPPGIPRLIEDPVEIPCVFRIGRFCLVHDSWWIPHRRRSRQARRVGARWLGGVAGDAPGQRLGAVGRWMELSGSRRCVVDGRRHDPWLAQTV